MHVCVSCNSFGVSSMKKVFWKLKLNWCEFNYNFFILHSYHFFTILCFAYHSSSRTIDKIKYCYMFNVMQRCDFIFSYTHVYIHTNYIKCNYTSTRKCHIKCTKLHDQMTTIIQVILQTDIIWSERRSQIIRV